MEPRQTLTISSVGQITIPRSIRKLLNLEKGAKLNLEVDQENCVITLKKQKSFDEVMAELDKIDEKYHTPKPDPRAKNMTINEMVEEQLRNHPLENDTWV